MRPFTRLHTRTGIRALVLLGGTLGAPGAAQAALPCSSVQLPQGQTSALVAAVVARTTGDSSLETGAAGDALVQQLVSSVCSGTDAGTYLVATCEPWGAARGLAELRRRVLVDVVRAPAAALDGQIAALSAEQRVVARLGLALLEGALSGADAQTFARRLADDSGLPAALRCNAEATRQAASDDVVLAGMIVSRLLTLSPTLDAPTAELEAAVLDELKRAGRARTALDATSRRALAALRQALRDLQASATARANLRVRTLALAALAQGAYALASGRTVVLPAALVDTVEALGSGDLPRAVGALPELARQLGLPAAQIPAGLETAARLAVARTREEATRVLRNVVLGLGPWSDPLLFDVDAVAPRVNADEFKLGGSLLLGYAGKTLGVAAHGSIYNYDFQRGTVIRQTESFGGGLDAWGAFGGGSTRFEGRFSGESRVYNTDLFSLAPGASAVFADETSVVFRGTLLAGLRIEPGERFAGGLWLGAGVQIESYDRAALTGVNFSDQTQDNTGLRLEGRLRLHYLIVPQWLAVRMQVDAQRYDLERNATAVNFDGAGSLTYAAEASTTTTVEAHARVFLDAEVARVFDFVPGITGGFDYYSLSGSNIEAQETTLPVIGVGIRRASY